MCGPLRYSLYGTRDAAQNWEEELASTLSGLGLTRGSACPCVWRGLIKREDVVATVHDYDITIGGQRTAVEFLVNMISKKFRHSGETQISRRAGEYSTVSLTGTVTESQLRQIRDNEGPRAGTSEPPCASIRCGKEGRKQGGEPMQMRAGQAQVGRRERR